MYRNFKLFSVFALVVLLLSTGIGTAQSLSNAQQPPSVSIEVDGKTIPIESGKNVHPQTYDLLSHDPDFASREDIKWIFVDDMWVPLKQTEELALREAPILEKTPSPDPSPEYIPECRITLDVPAYCQCDYSGHLFNDPTHCGTMCGWGCAITSSAMVFRYYGASTNPGQLNDCAANHGCRADCDGNGYDPCCLIWGCAANNCSDNEAGFVNYYDFYWSALCGLLSQDRPPIVDVGGHFVVVYKSLGNDLYNACDYYINDPADGSTYKKLCYYTNNPVSIVEYYNR